MAGTVLGGFGLYILGVGLFKWSVLGRLPASHAVALLALLGASCYTKSSQIPGYPSLVSTTQCRMNFDGRGPGSSAMKSIASSSDTECSLAMC